MADIVTIVGARPQFIKAAVINYFLKNWPGGLPLSQFLINTGQHYDHSLSDVFFKDLPFLEPDQTLNTGSGTPGSQLACMIPLIEETLQRESPKAVLIYGDTNSTLAGALAAVKLDIPIIHQEAGCRLPYRKQVPEEWNRVLSDHAAHLCLAVTKHDLKNLYLEGITEARALLTGDIMFDLFLINKDRALRESPYPNAINEEKGSYHICTIHRVENTDNPEKLKKIFESLFDSKKTIVLPLHPRTRNALDKNNLMKFCQQNKSLKLIEPLSYTDFQALLLGAHRVITDSGGVMREAYFAKKPCIVPRNAVWFPEIVEAGWAVSTGNDFDKFKTLINNFDAPDSYPEIFGDGKASKKVISACLDTINLRDYTEPW